MNRPLLYKYFQDKAEELLSNYKVSSGQNASRNLGDNRENFVNNFLKNSLPAKLIVRSGEIWDSLGFKTGQIDTLIIRDDAPSLDFGDKNSYLAEGVFGVIEVKSNLTSEKLEEAAGNLEKVKKLCVSEPTVTMGGCNLKRPLRIVFAYEGATWETLLKKLEEDKYRDLFDLVCILSRGVFVEKGRLMYAYNKDTGVKIDRRMILRTRASALGFLYYYLVQYGIGFSTGSIRLDNYFQPLEQWGSE